MKSCIIPRNDSLCALCPIREADKTGSHMVSNLLTAVTFSFDGKTKRDREIVELYHINNPKDNAIYYGSQVAPEKIAEDLGHEITDEELEKNTNLLCYDNIFCYQCECSVLNKLTLLKFEIHMEELKKKYTPYTESERMSYIREYLSTSETKYQFAKRTGICRRLLILWLEKYHINDKVMNTEQPSLSKASDESLNELEKELAALRAENRKLQRALQEESLRHEACEELINLAESTYHIKVRKNSDAK